MSVRKRISPKKFMLLCLLIYCSGVAGFVVFENYQAKKELFREIDHNLLLVASSLKLMLAPDFHDRAIDSESISFEEEMKNRQAMNTLARETGFVYIYTLIEAGGNYYFAAPTVTEHEAIDQRRWYYHPYADVPAGFVSAYRDRLIRYATYSDQWGRFRSIALPQRSQGGRFYLACADLDISYIDELLQRELLSSFLHAVFFIVLTLPFILFFVQHNRRLVDKNLELQRQKEKVSRLAEERLRTQIELMAARDEAEKASQEKSRFLANMSHEIRNPMNIISGMSHLAMESSSAEEHAKYLQNIRNATNLLLKIISDILDFSKIEAGQLELEQIPFQLKTLVNEVFNLNLMLAREKNIELRLDMDEKAALFVVGDPGRLQQILMNLVGNAIKFTDTGQVVIRVGRAGGNEELVQLLFSIEDTGIGIDAVQQERLFKPFSQGDGSYTRKYGGTGLGLVICKRLVEMMGGHIGMSSTPGAGSVFSVAVSFKVAQDTEKQQPQQHELLKFLPQSSARKNILVVDDQLLNRDLLSALLSQAGFQAETAENGLEAVEMACRHHYDLILMDIQMPEMDGLSASRAIRAAGNHAPIVAMTSHALVGDAEQSIAAGMNDHLTKPIEMQALHSTLLKWLPDLELARQEFPEKNDRFNQSNSTS